MLTRVTITGADDGVAPSEIAALSKAYPFVEWGILLSLKRKGKPRYPTSDWVLDVCGRVGVRLSAHFCGQFSREIQNGIHACAHFLPLPFGRCQINGVKLKDRGAGIVGACAFLKKSRPTLEMILQASGEDVLQDVGHLASALPNASVLFDPSGGHGLAPFRWPRAPLGVRMGYAGGIGPDNVREVLRAIGPVEAPFWIDMESRVRTNNRLDLAKVRSVLEAARPFVVGGAA